MTTHCDVCALPCVTHSLCSALIVTVLVLLLLRLLSNLCAGLAASLQQVRARGDSDRPARRAVRQPEEHARSCHGDDPVRASALCCTDVPIECILASSRNVLVSRPDAQNHVRRVELYRKDGIVPFPTNLRSIVCDPKTRFKIPGDFDWMQECTSI